MVSLVSLVEEDRDRQYFKSQVGLAEPYASTRQTPLSHSFCQYVKREGKPLIVRSAHDHPLVRDNLAIRDLNVVAYLGAPIFGADGTPLGALCVIDGSPRDWSDEEVRILSDLTGCVTTEIRLAGGADGLAPACHRLEAAHASVRHYNAVRETIAAAFMAPDLGIQDRFRSLLRTGCDALKMDRAAISRVTGAEAEVLCASHGPVPRPAAAAVGKLGKLPRRIMAEQRMVLWSDDKAADPEPVVQQIGAADGSYLGVPLVLEGVLFGVLEFRALALRPDGWSEDERSIASIVAMFASAYLGILGQIDRLQASEAAALGYIPDIRGGSRSENVFDNATTLKRIRFNLRNV